MSSRNLSIKSRNSCLKINHVRSSAVEYYYVPLISYIAKQILNKKNIYKKKKKLLQTLQIVRKVTLDCNINANSVHTAPNYIKPYTYDL